MKNKYTDLQYRFASSEGGQFVPYIGMNYGNGLHCEKGKLKILIIGPRHYCDARYNSRNVLIYNSRKDLICKDRTKSKLSTGNSFPACYEVGCTKRSAEKCLKSETKICNESEKCSESMCPVFKYKRCPLKQDCSVRAEYSINCRSRNLRCETLYAVDEFLRNPKIESARLGISYFGLLTEFIMEHFRPAKHDIKHVWENVAFFNLIQRYIPLKEINYDSDRIGRRIKESDINAARTIIYELWPDVIITTMPCVSKKLNSIFKGFEYRFVSSFNGYGYMLFCKKDVILATPIPKWQKHIDCIVSDYILPDKSYKLRKGILDIVRNTLDTYGAEIHGRSPEKEVRKYVRRAFVEKIKNAANISTSIRNIKCFNECCENPDEAIRQWLRYTPKN